MFDTVPIIAALLETICSSPAESSNPGAYIKAHAFEYRELLYFGDATLRYAYETLSDRKDKTDLESQILLAAARELTGDEGHGISAGFKPYIGQLIVGWHVNKHLHLYGLVSTIRSGWRRKTRINVQMIRGGSMPDPKSYPYTTQFGYKVIRL